jgi:hypothetical protein
MRTQNSFQDHLRSSQATVSKWPEWKKEVMGKVHNSESTSSQTKKQSSYRSTYECKSSK